MAVGIKTNQQSKVSILNDVDVQITRAEYFLHNENCYAKAVCVGEDGEEKECWWSCGRNLKPSADGRFLEEKEEGATLRSGTNFAFFMRGLETVWPSENIPDDGSLEFLVGANVHVMQVPEPERPNMKREEPEEKSADGKVYAKTVAVFSKINKFPSGAKIVNMQELDAEVEKIIVAILETVDKPIPWNTILNVGFANFKSASNPQKAQTRAMDIAFLKDKTRPWKFNEADMTIEKSKR